MIRLQGSHVELTAVPADEAGRRVLGQPLHRLFLRGALGGEPAGDDGSWNVPWPKDKAEVLERLLFHLERYSIAYDMDRYCQEVLRRLKEERTAYESTMKSALSVKRGSSRTQARLAKEGFPLS